MKDIPMFTGTHGLASLALRDISATGRAYVVVRAVWNGQTEAFLRECKDFCRAVGAEEIYASYGKEELSAQPVYQMLAMEREKEGLPEGRPVELEPLTKENGQVFLEIYNSCFRDVIGASVYGKEDLTRLYDTDCGFLAKKEGVYAGIAEISKAGLESIAVLPQYRGLGYDLALAVLPMIPRKTLRLKVASTNQRAIALYERLGFAVVETLDRWWKL